MPFDYHYKYEKFFTRSRKDIVSGFYEQTAEDERLQ